jgi:hypothetical protein
MRTIRRLVALSFAITVPLSLPAQDLARVGGDVSVFSRLPLPTPNEYRTGSGAPGHAYWQNRADYDIKARLDTAAKSLSGDLTLRYTNNSPDTLRYLWIQVEQNAFTEDALGTYTFPQNTRFGFRGFIGGYMADRVSQIVTTKPRTGATTTRNVVAPHRVEGTMMKVDLAEPLPPKGVAVLDLGWHFAVPEHGADRMGREGTLYELAQWYPRAAVYDDVSGWNTEPYLGQSEFYLEYGDFHVELTVPAGFIVAATGTLDNPKDVLTATQITRLAAAAKSDTVIAIVPEGELKSGAARASTTGTLTWKFTAKNVRDVAWAASPEYRWDASSWKGIMSNAYYRPGSASTWVDAADQGRMSIMEYSERWFPYPYPQISVVEGPVSGMEYPMLAMEARGNDKPDLYSVITHEVGHNWFPMIVGSNERLHFWMDEGFNTFINTFSEARRYPDKGDQMTRAASEREGVMQAMRANVDLTVDVPGDRIVGNVLGYAEYVKPSVGLQVLRTQVLGPDAFDDAFRTYIRRWAFKHPTPADFYRTMEDVSGKRLDWFWREWFVNDYRFDQAVDTVVMATRGDSTLVQVRYANRALGVMPIIVRFTFTDGTKKDFRYPVEAWLATPGRYVRTYTFGGKRPTRIELDPDHLIPDVNIRNNVWTAPPPPPGGHR